MFKSEKPSFVLNRKEIYWFLGTIILALLVNLIFFGIDGYQSDFVFDGTNDDNYLVVPNTNFIALIIVTTFFTVNLFRAYRGEFKNLTVSIILIVSNVILILLVSEILSIIETYIAKTSGWTIYPPLSAGENGTNVSSSSNGTNFFAISRGFFALQIMLLTLLVYTSFRTGRNYKSNN